MRRIVTCDRVAATIRPTKEEMHRVYRIVVGDRINYSGDKNTPTAKIQTIKAIKLDSLRILIITKLFKKNKLISSFR